MFDQMIARIRERNREDYQALLKDRVTDVRIWIQENPERSFIVALVIGSLFVLFFKTLLALAGLAAVIGFVIWSIALPRSGTPS